MLIILKKLILSILAVPIAVIITYALGIALLMIVLIFGGFMHLLIGSFSFDFAFITENSVVRLFFLVTLIIYVLSLFLIWKKIGKL
jgi:hypothetical protein